MIIIFLIAIVIFVSGECTYFRKKKHIEIQGATWVTRYKFYTEDQQILGATVQNVVASCELAPGICAPLIIVIRPHGL
jgi:hypothetical protein